LYFSNHFIHWSINLIIERIGQEASGHVFAGSEVGNDI
jgi:hypothetical protein